ncbi:MAG: hypothetical protein ACQET5_03680 [Halobacteriota archaeon]|uniref:hypothetical protein n=1 Tax=Natronomonas sp. TaxID=2184060 RepID=UPI003974D7C8
MSFTLLRGRPEERFKLSIGLLAGAVIALPANVLKLADWLYSPGLGYALFVIALVGVVFRKRAFITGVSVSILLISLPQAIAAVLPTPLTNWHVSAGILWSIALAILGCLYLMREAETRTDADIDPFWLFRPQE